MLVDILLSFSLIVTDVTRSLLRAIAGDSTDNGVLLAAYAVCGALGVSLGLSRLVFGFTGGVLFLARLLPRSGTGDVADCLDYVAFGRMELTRGLATRRSFISVKLCYES